jgi:dihydrolipoamide dehydrogenase
MGNVGFNGSNELCKEPDVSDFTHDLLIIGAGPGGYVAAIRASQLGLKTILIEKDKPGGVCLNVGCIPSKALLHQASLNRSLPDLAAMGLTVDASGFDYAKVWQKSRDIASRLAKGVAGLLRKNKVELVTGTATICGKNEVKVLTETGERTFQPKNILIASGSRPRSLPGYEFDGEQVLSSTDLLMLQELPASLVILGAGAIGVEFACIMASFGVQVSLVEMAPRILPGVDPEAAKVVDAALRKQGVNVYAGARTGTLNYEANVLSLECTQPDGTSLAIKAEKMLVAVGRAPNSENIGLESVGIKPEKGFIPVGDYYQTPVAGIYAIGDVINTPQLAHLASKEGETVVEYLAGKAVASRVGRDQVPFAVYAEPELASFGPSEEELVSHGQEIQAFSFPFLGIGRAVAGDCAQGFVRIIQSKSDRKILAATIVGPGATELIHELLLAREAGLGATQLASMIHAHPTLSEGVMEAARGVEGWAIHI